MADMGMLRPRHREEGSDFAEGDRGRPVRYGNSDPSVTPEEEELNRLIEEYPLSIGRYITLQWNFNRWLRKPYEDPAVIIGELARSTSKGACHRPWRNLMTAIQNIAAWKDSHATWKEARACAKMPRLPALTQIRALRYLDPDSEDMPAYIVASLARIKLDWMLTDESPGLFWRDAHLDNREWRERHMDDSDLPWPRLDNAPHEADAKKVEALMRAVFLRQPAGIFVLTGLAEVDKQETCSEPSVRIANPHTTTTYSTQRTRTPGPDLLSDLDAIQTKCQDKIASVQMACAELSDITCTILTHLQEEISEQKASSAQLNEELRQVKQRLRHMETQAAALGERLNRQQQPAAQQQQQQQQQQQRAPDFQTERERCHNDNTNNREAAAAAADGSWNRLHRFNMYDGGEQDRGRRATFAENTAARDKPPFWG